MTLDTFLNEMNKSHPEIKIWLDLKNETILGIRSAAMALEQALRKYEAISDNIIVETPGADRGFTPQGREFENILLANNSCPISTDMDGQLRSFKNRARLKLGVLFGTDRLSQSCSKIFTHQSLFNSVEIEKMCWNTQGQKLTAKELHLIDLLQVILL